MFYNFKKNKPCFTLTTSLWDWYLTCQMTAKFKILLLYSNVTNRTTPAICTAVMFYATWCPFSATAAPHFNALGNKQYIVV